MRVGFLQMRCKFGDVKKNVGRAVNLLGKVDNATIVLPELFNTGYLFKNKKELISLAETVPGGYTTSQIKKITKKNNLNVVFGIAQKVKKKVYNSAVFVNSEGKVDSYRKVHLFDREKFLFDHGTSLKVKSTDEAKLGFMICFDWLFPEAARTLTLKGAQVLCHPSNLVLPYGQDAMITRCIENRVFAITANRIGVERRGPVRLEFTGKSQIVSPDGEVLVSVGSRSESLKVIDIDISEADDKNINANNNVIEDRFSSYYSVITDK
ncbi:MAG: nitrilase-related carbon-nitrogen hydrolase [Candidatus Krumholzibacteriota bacterium]|nr:nitrilase-related carbon-nitrogen hydrolase [Candidatus Krumholzibacteriota bacterium]